MALDLPLPKQVYGHGWLLFDGGKVSKSKANSGSVIDPRILSDRYGIDAIRMFLIKEVIFGQDGPYTQELFLNSYNTNLANEYGNLVSRTIGMIGKYLGGILNKATDLTESDREFQTEILNKRKQVFEMMEDINPTGALNAVFEMFSRANKFIDENAPWVLAKSGEIERLNTVLNVLSETIIIVNTLLLPFLTVKPKLVYASWSLMVPDSFDKYREYGFIDDNTKVSKNENLYQRLDVNKEIDELNKIKV